MNRLNIKASALGIDFSLCVKGYTIPFNEWKNVEDGSVYAEIFQDFLDNGIAFENGAVVHVLYCAVYQLSEYERNILGIPSLYPYSIYIQSKGLLKDNDFEYSVSFRQSKLGKRMNVTREGAIVTCNGIKYLLRQEQLGLIEAICEFNALSMSQKTVNGNLIAFSRIKDLSKSARALLDRYLQNENTFIPQKLKIEIDRNEDETYSVVPTIEAPFQGDFDRYLGSRQMAPDNISISDENNGRIRVILDDGKRDTINTIKHHYTNVPAERLKQLVENPTSILNQDICDLSMFYSERVIDIGLYKPSVYPFVSPYKSSWIPAYTVEDRVNGTSTLTIETEEELLDFEHQIRINESQGCKSIEYKDIALNIEDAKQVAADAREKIESHIQHEKKEKKVLIIEENAEELGYLETFGKPNQQKGLVFHDIPGIKDDIVLKRHQIEGISWLQSLMNSGQKGCLLADDMGLGKTLQLLSVIDWHDKSQPEDDRPYLIVAPVSLLDNWQQEYERFFAKPRLRVRVIDGKVARHFAKDFDKAFVSYMQQHQIILTNYETLRSYQLSFCAVNYAITVLDEAQKVKTPGTLVTNSVKALKSGFKVAMTGTPVENTLVDLWCIMDFAVPGLLGNCKEFAKQYQHPLKDSDVDIVSMGNQIRDKMGCHFLRRLKADVARELPEKHLENVKLNMPEVQLVAYKRVVDEAVAERDSKQHKPGYMLTCIQKLKEISDHPYLETSTELYSVDELIESSAKLQAIMPILNNIKASNEKVIVFTERRETQRMLKRIIRMKYHVESHIINGETPSSSAQSDYSKAGKMSRQQAIDDFQAKNGFNVIIMSPIAAGMGLNVVGANHVIHYSRHWNPAKENQATDRVYRIGQKKPVFIYYPMAVSDGFYTFDETLDILLKRKSQLADATLFPSGKIEVACDELFDALMRQDNRKYQQ